MVSPMELLPVELLDMVIVHLKLSDNCQMRLVSQRLYANSLSNFSKRYFSKAHTSLSSPSLGRLLELLSRNYLAEAFSVLDIKLLEQSDYQVLRAINNVGIFPPPKRFPRVPRVDYRRLSDEIKLFDDATNGDSMKYTLGLLIRVLRNMPNLRTIRFHMRFQNSEVKCEDRAPEDHTFHNVCFETLLDAIAKSGIQLEELRLPKGKPFPVASHRAGLCYPAFNMSMTHLPTLSRSLTCLRSLALCINTQYHGYSRIPGWENGIAHFICAASSLEELSLNLDSWCPIGHSAAVIKSLARSTVLPQLKVLKIYGCRIVGRDLVNFAGNHASSLRCLTLAHIDLFGGLWRDQLVCLRDTLNLDSLQLMGIREENDPVFFPWRSLRKREYVSLSTGKSSKQRPMKDMLDEVINKYVVGYEAFADAILNVE